MDENTSEKIEENARKLIITDEKLKLAYQRGEISKVEFEEKHKPILEKLDALKKKKVQMESEKNRLLAELLHLRGELKDGRIDNDTYARRFSEIQGEMELIEDPERQLKAQKGIVDYRYHSSSKDYYIFPTTLWIILMVFAIISIISLFLFTDFIFTALSHIPPQYKGMVMSYLLFVPIILIIGVLIGAAILWVSAYIAGVEEVTYSGAITCIIASFIVGFGLSIIFSLLPLGAFFIGSSIGLIILISWMLLILRLILFVFLDLWIIKSVFYTTWVKAVITWIISLVIGFIVGIVISTIITLLFGSLFFM